MPVYYFLIDATLYGRRIVPALAETWRGASFEHCRELCISLVPAAQSFAEKYHAGAEESLLSKVARGIHFDRHYFQLLVGEIFLFTASEIPELELTPETLCYLLAPDRSWQTPGPRERTAPIQRALYGSRDITFGSKVFRPELAGFNDVHDVVELSAFLDSVDAASWTIDGLRQMSSLEDDADREDELELAKEWFPALQQLYGRAVRRNDVIVSEIL